MAAWTDAVDEPFRSDARFWRSMTAALGALVSLVAAALLQVLAGGAAAVLYAVPVGLFAVAAVSARASSTASRAQFASDEEWRDAERRAVATALVPRRRRSP